MIWKHDLEILTCAYCQHTVPLLLPTQPEWSSIPWGTRVWRERFAAYHTTVAETCSRNGWMFYIRAADDPLNAVRCPRCHRWNGPRANEARRCEMEADTQ